MSLDADRQHERTNRQRRGGRVAQDDLAGRQSELDVVKLRGTTLAPRGRPGAPLHSVR